MKNIPFIESLVFQCRYRVGLIILEIYTLSHSIVDFTA